MKMFDVYGCAAVDLQDNLVKPSNNGDLIPVSMGLGTITDIDQSFMGANIRTIQSKYDKIIFVCGTNVFEELKSARFFLDNLPQHATFVITGGSNYDIRVQHYSRMQGSGSWVRGKEFNTGLNIKSNEFKQSVERVITSLSYTKSSAVFVMGGKGCYEMFAQDYDKFFVSQIKQDFSIGNVDKKLQLPHYLYERTDGGVYEDDDIEQFIITQKINL